MFQAFNIVGSVKPFKGFTVLSLLCDAVLRAGAAERRGHRPHAEVGDMAFPSRGGRRGDNAFCDDSGPILLADVG